MPLEIDMARHPPRQSPYCFAFVAAYLGFSSGLGWLRCLSDQTVCSAFHGRPIRRFRNLEIKDALDPRTLN